jgi:hypothetical protein
VNVALNAPASVINTAAVSGGGEQNTGNNTASDPTTIQPALTYGQITPTGTTCAQFAARTAPDLNELVYTVNSGRVKTITPSSFMYFTKVIAPAASFTIKVSQSNTGGWPNLATAYSFAKPQINVYNANCAVIKASADFHSSYITFSLKGATAGAVYYVSIRYQTDRVLGKSVRAPYPTVPYTFKTAVNNVALTPNTDSINFRPH